MVHCIVVDGERKLDDGPAQGVAPFALHAKL